MTQHYAMLQRNVLYTGVTRGKKLVVLVGQKKAVAIAVRNVSGRRRWSKLQEWLRPKDGETVKAISVGTPRRTQEVRSNAVPLCGYPCKVELFYNEQRKDDESDICFSP
jgi:hypothetical protein